MKRLDASADSFWDAVHRKFNDDGDNALLTGSSPQNVLVAHQIDPTKMPRDEGSVIMDIGVGTGGMTKYLLGETRARIVPVDVSAVALARLRDLTETYGSARVTPLLTTQMDRSPPVDMAICHLVIQHCAPEEVVALLGAVPLTPRGWISVQFCHTVSDGMPTDAPWWTRDNTHFSYTPSEMDRLIHESGLAPVGSQAPTKVWHKDWGVATWHFRRLRKAG